MTKALVRVAILLACVVSIVFLPGVGRTTSPTLTLTVVAVPSTLLPGQSTQVTATFGPAGTGYWSAPTGNVTFTVCTLTKTVPVGPDPTLTKVIATAAFTPPSSCAVTASYPGDAKNTPVSASTSLIVQTTPTLALSISKSTVAAYVDTPTFTARLTALPMPRVGTVDFGDGFVTFGSASVVYDPNTNGSTATFTPQAAWSYQGNTYTRVPLFSVGLHNVVATLRGGGDFTTASSPPVQLNSLYPTAVGIQCSAYSVANICTTASYFQSQAPNCSAWVERYMPGQNLGLVPGGTVSFTTTAQPFTFTLRQAATTTTTTSAPRTLQTATVSDGVAPYTVAFGPGSLPLTASYLGDSQDLPSTGSPCTINIYYPITVKVSAPSTVSLSGTFTVSATVTASVPGAPTINGTLALANGPYINVNVPITNGTGSATVSGSLLHSGLNYIGGTFTPAPASPQMIGVTNTQTWAQVTAN